MDQTVEYLRHVYSNHIDSNPEGLLTANKYSWNNTAQIISNTLVKNNSYANTKTKR